MARIALVHDVAGVAETQAQILRDAGHEVDHLRLSTLGGDWAWPAKATTLPLRLTLELPAVRRLRSGPYDVIHIHWVSQGIAGLLSGKPFLIQAHGTDLRRGLHTPGMRTLNRLVLERAKTILFATPNLKEELREFAAKSVYLPNPIDLDAVGAPLPPPVQVRRALVYTRLDPVKGVDRIFPAAQRLAAAGVELAAVRWGPLAAEYTRRYSGVVRFVEQVPHRTVGEFLRGFDLVIGQMEQGALGLSELEAMAAGRPVITGIDWNLYPDDRPPVLPSHGADELVAQVLRLKDDARRLENVSREGHEWVRRNHGFERHLRLLESAYFGAPARVSGTPIAM